jgi:H+-transporting ATPase
VWVYALAWFLISDRIKLLAYRILDPKTDEVLTGEAVVRQSPNSAPTRGPETLVSSAGSSQD